MGAFDWLDDDGAAIAPQDAPTVTQQPTGCYQRLMVIELPAQHAEPTSEPFSALSGLPLLAGDKTYLHGVLAGLQLPDAIAHALLTHYRQQWERAAKRCTNPNGVDNAGRRAANTWVQHGCNGFMQYQDVDKPP